MNGITEMYNEKCLTANLRANKSINCSSTQMGWCDLFFFSFVHRSHSQSPFYHSSPDSLYFLHARCSVLCLPISMVRWDRQCIPQQLFCQHISLAWLSDLAEGVGALTLSLVIYSCTFSIIHCWLAFLKHAVVPAGYSSKQSTDTNYSDPHLLTGIKLTSGTHCKNIIKTIY